MRLIIFLIALIFYYLFNFLIKLDKEDEVILKELDKVINEMSK